MAKELDQQEDEGTDEVCIPHDVDNESSVSGICSICLSPVFDGGVGVLLAEEFHGFPNVGGELDTKEGVPGASGGASGSSIFFQGGGKVKYG